MNGELGVGAPEVEQLTLPTVMDFAESWNVKQGKIFINLFVIIISIF